MGFELMKQLESDILKDKALKTHQILGHPVPLRLNVLLCLTEAPLPGELLFMLQDLAQMPPPQGRLP